MLLTFENHTTELHCSSHRGFKINFLENADSNKQKLLHIFTFSYFLKGITSPCSRRLQYIEIY